MAESKVKSISTGAKVTIVGSVVNIILSGLKLAIGVIGDSRALIADGIHSLSDLASDVVVLFGLHYGNRPADRDHHYGHKKIETITELILGLILILIAVKMARDAGIAIWTGKHSHPKIITIVAAALSILSKEWLFRWTKAVAINEDNRAIMANAWHHRSDALSSIAVLIGLIAVQITHKLAFMDAAASLVVSILIIKVGWEIIREGYKRIIDTAPPAEYIDKIYGLINDYPKVRNPHKLKMRYVGNFIHMEVHIEVAPEMTVLEGHEIAAGVKHMILDQDKRVMDVTVHVEPEGESKKPH